MPFAERIDHSRYAVTYVTIQGALRTVPHDAAAVYMLEDLLEARAAVHDLVSTFGRPDRIVARAEYDLTTASSLRSELDVPGDLPEDVLPFRDKLVMCSIVAAAGVLLPSFADARTHEDVARFASEHGFPVVVKPRLGATSRDVRVLDSAMDLASLPDLTSEPYLVQRYCPDPVGHIDGVWTGEGLAAWRASTYVDTCLSFATGGAMLGSVELDDPDILTQAESLATAVCRALSDGRPQVFHLEYFLGNDNDGKPRLQFLEIAARAGGTEIGYIWRDVHGFDLLGEALDIQMGRPPRGHDFDNGVIGGFLVIRPSITPPCTVISTRMPDTPLLSETLYDKEIPVPGQVISQNIGYVNVGAAFRFRGDSTAQILESIAQTVTGFHMNCVPLD